MTDLYYFDPNAKAEIKKELDEFSDRAALIIEHVFHRPYDERQAFRRWFQDLQREYDNPVFLLHEDPLVIAARYSGIDPHAALTGTMFLEYQQLARKHHW